MPKALDARRVPCWCYAFFQRGTKWVTERGYCVSMTGRIGLVRVKADQEDWPFPKHILVERPWLTWAKPMHKDRSAPLNDRVLPEGVEEDEWDVRAMPLLPADADDARREIAARKRLRRQKARKGNSMFGA